MHSSHPFLDDAVTIRWSRLTPEHIEPDMTAALADATRQLDAIAARDPADTGYAEAFHALEEAELTVGRPWGVIGHLDAVLNEPAQRAAYNRMLPQVSAFFAAIPLRADLWRVLRAVGENPAVRAGLTPARLRFIDETLAIFREAGADLDPAAKERLLAIEEALATKTQKFSENTLDSTNAFELLVDDPARLAGLPESYREAARRDALARGHGSEAAPCFRFTLKAPSLVPALKFIDDTALRRQLWEGQMAVASTGDHDNTGLLREILELRAAKANLLGRAHFPDLVLARRMARSGATALEFVENLHRRTKAAFDRENAELAAFRAQTTGTPPAPLPPWDQAYWAEKMRRAQCAFDEEALRPYFALPQVLKGLFELTETVFGARVSERPDKPEVWHPEVRFYDVHDARDGSWLGSFYADWHPRDSKRGGAWMNVLRHGDRVPGKPHSPHVGLMCGNMNAPVGDTPALLTHAEVETVFHEFGHLLHHLLGDVEVRSLNGVSVAWDFVELPSQIMENWCWERASLDLFARHHQTGEPIPDELFARLTATRKFHAARAQMRQLTFGRMDLALHLEPQPFLEGDLDAALASLLADYLIPSPLPYRNTIRQFGHLFSDPVGYASGYYSYKWAEVLDADAFTRFHREGLLNPATGADFRTHILSRGNSAPPEELYRAFMGRDPDPQALFDRMGI
jgi:oligopeptidase A